MFALLISVIVITIQDVYAQEATVPTEIVEMQLVGEGRMPLGTNFVPVLNRVTIEISNTNPSIGQSNYQFPGNPSDVTNGQEFVVDSFFDVFFDITIEDIDLINDNDGRVGTIFTTPLGYRSISSFSCVAGISQPNFGCLQQLDSLMPENIVIPLDVDINGDNVNDEMNVLLDIPLEAGLIENLPTRIQLIVMYPFFPISGAALRGEINPTFLIPLTGTLTITEEIFYFPPLIGGEIIPIDTTSLLLAGVQTNLAWMIPIALSVVGIGVILLRKKF